MDKDAEQQLKLFEAQVFPHTTVLLRTASRICHKNAESDDIVQETLLRAWKYWDTFEAGSNCRAWLFRIMFNVIRRRNEGLEATVDHISVDEPQLSNVLRFEPRLELDEEGVLVAMERLPIEYREIILLVLVEEFSYKDVALMLNIPMGTVMSRLHRARLLLKKYLRPFSNRSINTI